MSGDRNPPLVDPSRAGKPHPQDSGGDHPSRLAQARKDPWPAGSGIDDLAEQNFGEWQGLAHGDLHQSRAGDFHRFWHAPAHEAAPGGESFLAVIERVSRALNRLVETYAGRDIIAVAHGGTIRAALALALDLAPEAALAFTIENCSVTRIDHIDGPGMGHGWRVVTVNRPPR